MALRMGSWGLPEFGITERLQSLVAPNKPLSPQGGSNLFGGGQANTGSILGATAPLASSPQANNIINGDVGRAPTQTGVSSGGGVSGGGLGLFTPPSESPQSDFVGQSNDSFNGYLSSLDEQIFGLNDQRSAQEKVAENSYQQGLNTATGQYNNSRAELDVNRQKTLRDLSRNLQSSFQQGNSYLGTRGASDSSAANQYAFALSKLGSQQRGEVQGQYDQNLFKLKNVYDTETKNLELEKNNQLQHIAQWFSEAQNQLRGQKGQIASQRSQQALSIAMQMAQQVQQQQASRRSTLDQWAANHATSFGQLQQALSSTGSFNVNAPNSFAISGNSSIGPQGAAVGYGQEKKYDMFGNVIS